MASSGLVRYYCASASIPKLLVVCGATSPITPNASQDDPLIKIVQVLVLALWNAFRHPFNVAFAFVK
jgi:hypothetical protein